MPDTPMACRGLYYNTHLDARCPNFHQCKRCMMCTQFNRNLAMCVTCESNKRGMRHCGCSDNQQYALVQLEKRMGRPMFSLNDRPKDVSIDTADDAYNADLVQKLGHMPVKEL